MLEITPEVMESIASKIESPEYPDVSEWSTTKTPVFISDEGNIIFRCDNVEDAERTLYAMMRVIAGEV